VLHELGRDHRFIAPDMLGFGRSEMPSGPRDDLGADAQARIILELLDHLGIESAGVVAHDSGAYVAQILAREHPSRISNLLFFNCPTPGVGRSWIDNGHYGEIWYTSFHQFDWTAALVGHNEQTLRIYLEHFLTHWPHQKDAFANAIDLWVDNFGKAGALQGGFNWYRGQLAGRLAVINGQAAPVPVIHQPTRVHWGRHDPVLKSEWSERLSGYFSNLQLSFAEECGHFVHVEAPAEAAAVINETFGA
jgi:pimeloyl-ACP methyl ester carboxylesterase